MDWLRILISRSKSVFVSRKLDDDLDEELRAHIDLAVREKVERGLSRNEAREAAQREFGGVARTREAYRLQRGLPFCEIFVQDLRFAIRQLIKSPGFAATAILTLALGIGANTAMFSIVQGVLLAPLPYTHPDRLTIVYESRPTTSHIDISYPDFLDWQRMSRSFDGMAALTDCNYNLTSPGAAAHLAGLQVTAGFFPTLETELALGRNFSPGEDQPHGASSVIISDRLWRERFAANPQAIGKSLILDGVAYTVIGVLPSDFLFPVAADVYTPLARGVPLLYVDRTIHGVAGLARLKPGVSLAGAEGELGAVQQNLDRLYPQADRNLGIALVPLKQEIVGDVRATLLLLFGAVGLVLLIACANIANLLLARSAARTQEFGVRSALGASRVRIVRQLLTESMLLSLAGGLIGVVLAKVGVKIALMSLHDTLPRSENIHVSLTVLLFTFVAAIAVGILFGLGPALKSARVDLQSSLKRGARGSTGERSRAQSSLVIVQMALTLVLLAGSGLLLRTIRDLLQVNPGFDARHVITFKAGISPKLAQTASGIRTAYRQLVDRIRTIPGVEAADLTNIVPLSGNDNSGPFWLGTQQPASPQDAPHAIYFWTGEDYLNAMKIPLLQGRFFNSSDTPESEHVVIIDSDLARIYFPGKSPVGETITVAHWGSARIAGVVGHVRHWGLDDPTAYNPGQIYISVYQIQDALAEQVLAGYLTIVVRTPLDAAAILPEIRSAVYDAAGDQPIYNIKTLDQVVSASMASKRLPMILLAAFAALALLLASVGIYGVISYSVAGRIQEIGVRMALGASRRNVLRMVIAAGLRLTATGLAIGVVSALALGRILVSFSSLLYGVRAGDPLTLLVVSLVLALAAVAACVIPARRAMRIDPVQALRSE